MDQRPRDLARAFGPELIGVWVALDEHFLTLFGAGVVRLPIVGVLQCLLKRLEQSLALVPLLVLDDDPSRDAVEPRVVAQRRGEVDAVKVEVLLRPGAGDDDDRAHVAELAAQPFGVAGLAIRLATCSFLANAEDDGIVSLVGSGDVNLFDQSMRAEILAFCSASVHHPKETSLAERRECLVDERAEILVDRIHLQEDDLALHDELVERIHRPDRSDVACAEH